MVLPPLGVSGYNHNDVPSKAWILSPIDSKYRYFTSTFFIFVIVSISIMIVFNWSMITFVVLFRGEITIKLYMKLIGQKLVHPSFYVMVPDSSLFMIWNILIDLRN